MTMAWTKVEAELAAVLVDDLRERGWQIYQEVEWHQNGACCDIVAVQGGILWAIETKISLGASVLSQAKRWIGHANLASCAVASARHSEARRFCQDAAAAFGIGVLEVSREGHDYGWTAGGPAKELVRPRFTRRCSPRLRSALREEQKTHAVAGNAGGKRFTAFAATCIAIRRQLELDGPMTVSLLVKRLGDRHHYASEASAKGSIRSWAEAGKIAGVELHRPDREPAQLRLAAGAETAPVIELPRASGAGPA